jgi:hypothetical protein
MPRHASEWAPPCVLRVRHLGRRLREAHGRAPLCFLGEKSANKENMKTIRKVMWSVLLLTLTPKLFAQIIPPGGSGGGGTNTYTPPPDISNYLKYQAQLFLVLDTNAVASTDANLFNALASFSDDSGTNPVLQVMPYQGNCLLFKASHFDYTGESVRDFCLVVGDKLETPLFKSIDLSTPSNNIQNGGWLVQGSVPRLQVTDSMFLMVSNTSRIYNGFFRVIPYGGPDIQLSGYNAYDVVSNTITLQAAITDLSGITNEAFDVTVDGFKARYGVGTNNTINLDTPYNPNGSCTLYAKVGNSAMIYDPTNPPGDAKLFFSGSTTLPLDFENDTYMAFAGDNSSPDIGTTYSLFVINKAQDVEATIYAPSDGHIVAHYIGYMPQAATIEIPWNFTEADGVTPYTNDTYVVNFIAYDPANMSVTNSIDRHGVRVAARNILTYEEENPSASAGTYLNSQANTLINSLESALYENLYSRHQFSFTQYETWQIGSDRENVFSSLFPWVLTQGQEASWLGNTSAALGSYFFSDFTYYMGHSSGIDIGGGPRGDNFVNAWMTPQDAARYVLAGNLQNWRMRKVALWGCYTESDFAATAGGVYPTWAQAFGIRRGSDQISSFMTKNAGLFFAGALPQGGYSGTTSGTSVEVATQFDQLWVCGPNAYPGGCDPTYAFSWAVAQIRNINPELDSSSSYPTLEGFPYLPYAGVYDSEIMTNDVSNVKR